MNLRVIDDDHFHDHCAVVGVYGHDEAANMAYLGLYALQHRGQESGGIVAMNEGQPYRRIGAGLVADIFDEDDLRALAGRSAIGHVRYSTSGEIGATLRDAQPLNFRCGAGPMAIAHNGNLTNNTQLRESLTADGSIFTTTSDTEVLCHLVARAEGTISERLEKSLRAVKGAYSLTVLTADALIGARDPHGFRPLVLGRLNGSYVLASETCAFDLIGGTLVREIEPGEMVIIDDDGVRSVHIEAAAKPAHCVFEHIYFARPDSVVFSRSVHAARKAMGRILARQAPVEADVVIPVPDSGFYAAMGFASEANTPFEMGLVRNHYVGRTFIEPEQGIRNFGVRLKLNPVRALLEGRRVIVVDDSIVRGTTSRKIVELIRKAGAKEVHMRVSAPPTTHPCHYGIDTPDRAQLIAANMEVSEIADAIGADSLAYLTLDGLAEAMEEVRTGASTHFCHACFSGDYPVALGGAPMVGPATP